MENADDFHLLQFPHQPVKAGPAAHAVAVGERERIAQPETVLLCEPVGNQYLPFVLRGNMPPFYQGKRTGPERVGERGVGMPIGHRFPAPERPVVRHFHFPRLLIFFISCGKHPRD